MTCPCSKRAICFFVTRDSAQKAVTAIARCALRPSQSLFIFRIGQRVWRQRAYTICTTSRPSMKQIGPAKRKLPRGKLRRGFLTLAHSAPGWSLHREDFFARSCADATQRRIYIKVASMNRGLMISRSECCAINSRCAGRFHRPVPPTLDCSFFGASRLCLPAAASVSYCHPFLAEHAREILDYVNSGRAGENGRKVTARAGEDEQVPDKMSVAQTLVHEK